MEDGLAEVLVVHGDLPVLRLVLLIEVRIEVEGVEVGVEAALTHRADQIRGFRIGQPIGGQRGIDGSGVDLAAAVQLGGNRAGFLVIGLLDALDEHIVRIPVGFVLGEHALLLRGELGKDVRAAIEDGVVARGHAEVRAHLVEERFVHGHEGHVRGHGQEIRHRVLERVLQGVIVQRLHAHGFPIHRGRRFLALGGGSGAIVIFFRTGDHIVEDRGGAGGVLRVEDVFRGGHKVVRGHVGVVLAVVIHPGGVLSQVERPHQAVIARGPALRQRGLHLAQAVVFHQRIDHVGGDGEVVRRGGHQVVQRGDLARVQRAVHIAGGGFFRRGGQRRQKQRRNQKPYEGSFHSLDLPMHNHVARASYYTIPSPILQESNVKNARS